MSKTYYVYDGENVITELDELGSPQVTYNYNPQGYGELLTQERDGHTYHYHQDALGSTRQLTDENGDITDEYTYSAWGETIEQTGTTKNPFRWIGSVGYYWDEETADYYVRARYYQPVIGRWLSRDPLGFIDGSNLYLAYFLPSRVDPSGRQVCGIYVYIYTGSWCADESVYNDALDAAAKTLLCWLECEEQIHTKVTTYVSGVVTSTASWSTLERLRIVGKSAEEMKKNLGGGKIRTHTSILSRISQQLKSQGWDRASKIIRYHMRYIKSSPIKSIGRTCAAGVIITETIISIRCSLGCNK